MTPEEKARLEVMEAQIKGIQDALQGLNPRNLAGLSEKQIVGASDTVGSLEVQGAFVHTGTTVGFYSETPVAQHSAIGALTDSTGGTANATVDAVSGSGDDATINNNFADIIAKVNGLEETVRLIGLSA